MSDLISRRAAIDAVKHMGDNYSGKGVKDWHPHIDFVINELENVPSGLMHRKEDELSESWKTAQRSQSRRIWVNGSG